MNRPRNRQPRGGAQQHDSARRGGRGSGRGGSAAPRDLPPVPSVRQVVPGTAVSVVLKEDQPTGREVQGTVQDLLTRGDHPRGIKVRLTDGRVGRVQRMSSTVAAPSMQAASGDQRPQYKHVADARYEDDYAEGPPPRTFADYIPDLAEPQSSGVSGAEPTFATAIAKCPICDDFEGDEIAVSRHVADHFTDAACG